MLFRTATPVLRCNLPPCTLLHLLQDEVGVRLTQVGYIKGKPGYLAPEQLTDEPLDGRADLVAVGITLHECLTGQPLFTNGRYDRETYGVLEARPVYGYLASRFYGTPREPTEMIIGFGLAAALCIAATIIPIGIAKRRLEAVER